MQGPPTTMDCFGGLAHGPTTMGCFRGLAHGLKTMYGEMLVHNKIKNNKKYYMSAINNIK